MKLAWCIIAPVTAIVHNCCASAAEVITQLDGRQNNDPQAVRPFSVRQWSSSVDLQNMAVERAYPLQDTSLGDAYFHQPADLQREHRGDARRYYRKRPRRTKFPSFRILGKLRRAVTGGLASVSVPSLDLVTLINYMLLPLLPLLLSFGSRVTSASAIATGSSGTATGTGTSGVDQVFEYDTAETVTSTNSNTDSLTEDNSQTVTTTENNSPVNTETNTETNSSNDVITNP